MKAVVFRGIGRVSVEDVPDPSIEDPADAIVRVTSAGICGSDLHFFHGQVPLLPGETIGHQAVGVVEEAGPGVERFRAGDRVVVAMDIVCGTCWFCRRGQTALCEDFRNLGAGTWGGSLGGAQAELVRIPVADTNLLGVPQGVDDERALCVGDALTTGYYGAAIAGIDAGDTVAVIGAGPVGFFSAQAARLHGAGQVLVLDMEPDRLALGEKVGAVPVNVKERNAQMAVHDATEGRGADVVMEAVGAVPAFESAVEIVRRGGSVCVLGLYSGQTVEMQLGIYWVRAIRLQFAGLTPVHAWWDRAMDAVAAGEIDPMPLISHRLPLAEAARGYELFDSRQATQVVLRP
jgi:threonine dehydrogenase-like Zn-dependent dehydrogenase